MIVIHCDICQKFGQIEITDTYYASVGTLEVPLKLKISLENAEELCRDCWQALLSTAPPATRSAEPVYDNLKLS